MTADTEPKTEVITQIMDADLFFSENEPVSCLLIRDLVGVGKTSVGFSLSDFP